MSRYCNWWEGLDKMMLPIKTENIRKLLDEMINKTGAESTKGLLRKLGISMNRVPFYHKLYSEKRSSLEPIH